MSSSHERLRAFKGSFSFDGKEHRAWFTRSQTDPPSLLDRSHQSHRTSKNSLSHVSTRCARLWFPGKGIRDMSLRMSVLFYWTKIQTRLFWWKTPQNFGSKKVLRWIEHGVKDNPTVMVIQKWSKQSFQPHHPRVSETPPSDFFF